MDVSINNENNMFTVACEFIQKTFENNFSGNSSGNKNIIPMAFDFKKPLITEKFINTEEPEEAEIILNEPEFIADDSFIYGSTLIGSIRDENIRINFLREPGEKKIRIREYYE